MEAKEQISGDWVRNELMVSANAYQAFTRQVWEAIIKHSKRSDLRRIHKATQVARMHEAVAFLSEANLARKELLLAAPAWRADGSVTAATVTTATLWGAMAYQRQWQGDPGNDGLAFSHSSVFCILSSVLLNTPI